MTLKIVGTIVITIIIYNPVAENGGGVMCITLKKYITMLINLLLL
jgi:predicted transcriptional regulator